MQPNQTQTNLNPFSSSNPSLITPATPKGKNPKTLQDKIRDFIQTHRALSVVIIIIVAFLIFTGVILLIESRLPVQLEPEVAPATYFDHRYLLEYSIGRSNATQVFSDLNGIILNPESIASAPHANDITSNENPTYACTLIESSYKKLSTPENTYQVNLEVSDGRTYRILTRLSPTYGNYLVVVADRTDSNSAPDYAFIHTSDPDQYSAELNQWFESLNLTSLTVSTSTLTTADID